MIKCLILLGFFALVGCSGVEPYPTGHLYESKLGNFNCGPFKERVYPTYLSEKFGPHGGTVKFNIGLSMIRIDVQELNPTIPLAQRAEFYPAYISKNNIPHIQNGVPNAKLLHEESIVNDEQLLHFSLVLMPDSSDYEDADGKRSDAVRGQIHYLSERFIYTMSKKFNLTSGDDPLLKLKYYKKAVLDSFKQCRYPVRCRATNCKGEQKLDDSLDVMTD